MRYRNSNNEKKRRYRKCRKKDRKPRTSPSYFSIDATILTYPRHECSIFRGTELRQEVTVTAVIHWQDDSSRYPLRFTNKATLESASDLKPGTSIHIIKGRFDYRHKRAETELRVSEFSVRS
jgi:hypothetical protein